jgi:predicted nucleotidyltransferase
MILAVRNGTRFVTRFDAATAKRYGEMMSKSLQNLMEDLRALKPELRARFGVLGISVFGSFVRGDATDTSDLDLLIRFEDGARPTLFSLSDMDALLEERLGVPVDTVPESSLNPRIEPYIRSTLLEV